MDVSIEKAKPDIAIIEQALLTYVTALDNNLNPALTEAEQEAEQIMWKDRFSEKAWWITWS